MREQYHARIAAVA